MSYIKLKIDGKEYKLGFSKRTVRQLERNGFKIDDVGDRPTTYFPVLFYGAFLKYQPRMKEDEALSLLGKIKNMSGLSKTLIELYQEPAEEMFEEPSEDDPNAGTWEKAEDL